MKWTSASDYSYYHVVWLKEELRHIWKLVKRQQLKIKWLLINLNRPSE